MRAIDISIFLIIFEVIGNLIAVNYAPYMGFGQHPLLKMEINSTDPNIITKPEPLTQELWGQTQTYATIIIAVGLVAGTIVSAVFGQYYVVALLSMALVITVFVPAARVYVTALPQLLINLGIPVEVTGLVFVIYNLILVLSILVWLSGRSLKEY